MEGKQDVPMKQIPEKSSWKNPFNRFLHKQDPEISDPTLKKSTTEITAEKVREQKIAEIIDSISKHGLVGARKAKELGIKLFRGGDGNSLGDGEGCICVSASEFLDFKEFQKADDERLGRHDGQERSEDNYKNGYIPRTVGSIVNGESQRSPVTILGERKNTYLAKEIEEFGKKIVEDRLSSGILMLMSTKENITHLTMEEEQKRQIGKVGQEFAYGFPELPLNLVEAIFVPEGLSKLVRDNVPWRLKGKIIKVTGEIKPQKDDRLYDYEIAGNNLKIPDWYPAVLKYLSHAKLNKTFMMHAVRLPTLTEVDPRNENAPSV